MKGCSGVLGTYRNQDFNVALDKLIRVRDEYEM